MKILLVEDDEALAEGVIYSLKKAAYEVLWAADVAAAKAQMSAGDIDMLLLDIMLPDGDGLSFCEKLRKEDKELPVIFLTALDDEEKLVRAFGLGADDYVTKPFRMGELLARIGARGRRSAGGLVLDDMRLCARRGSRRIDLSPNEYRLLGFFLRHPGEVLGRQRLARALWEAGVEYTDENAVAVWVNRLREKLRGDDDYSPIRTLRGEGYVWEEIK